MNYSFKLIHNFQNISWTFNVFNSISKHNHFSFDFLVIKCDPFVGEYITYTGIYEDLMHILLMQFYFYFFKVKVKIGFFLLRFYLLLVVKESLCLLDKWCVYNKVFFLYEIDCYVLFCRFCSAWWHTDSQGNLHCWTAGLEEVTSSGGFASAESFLLGISFSFWT